jgi:sugar-specific transcriptional regulator TrmB
MRPEEQAPELLRSLGLNRLEAEVYTFLLQRREAVTGYRVAKALGRPTANVYKAIDALARKGAVAVDEGARRLCRPTSPAEFLGQLEHTLLDRTRQAARLLANLRPADQDERVYDLQSPALVLERCRAMLDRSRVIALVDAFPRALQAVLPAIRAAVQRGVEVHVQTYEPRRIPGARVVQAHGSDEILANWTSEQLNVVVDSQEMLLALFHTDLSSVHQAIWTSSLYLSCITHVGLLREHVFHNVAALSRQPGFPPRLRRLLEQQPFFHAATAPGQQKLLARFAAVRPATQPIGKRRRTRQ